MLIPFNRPSAVGAELDYIRAALESGKLAGDGPFTARCHAWLRQRLGVASALLTHSGTGALEMACLVADLQPGDEVILPSYTFVSTANAVVLRGAVPVFVDIRRDTLNLDEALVEAAITPRTRAIIAVHYAGICAEMDRINAIAASTSLFVIEDAAQAFLATYRGRLAGTLSDAGCFSFHETKNIISGEGGALVLSDGALSERAEIIREKGTNRKQFFRGMVDKYTWVAVGSSYLPSELIAAFLYAQLEVADEVISERGRIWQAYHEGFAGLEAAGLARRPIVPAHCEHNGHLYYLLLDERFDRERVIAELRARNIVAPFHYVPLHSSPAGRRFGRVSGEMTVTDDVSSRLVRLPIFLKVGTQVDEVIDAVHRVLERAAA